MRQMVVRLFLFVALYVLLGYGLKALLPYSWGNPWVREKVAIIEQLDEAPNIYFIGSSRIYRHVIPTVFDSVMTAHGKSTRSFNLAAPSTFAPQTYHLLKGAVTSGDIPTGSLVLLEVGFPQAVEKEHLGTAFGSYWTSFKDLMWIRDLSITCLEGSASKAIMQSSHSIAFLQNFFHWGQFKGMAREHKTQYEELGGLNSAGYRSLDKDLLLEGTMDGELLRRSLALDSDTSILMERRILSTKVRKGTSGHTCSPYRDKLMELEDLCTTNGVRLIHVLPPKKVLPSEWATFLSIPEERRVDMGDPNRYPEFYVKKYSFDKGHLNEEGAKLLSEALALELLQRSKDTPYQ